MSDIIVDKLSVNAIPDTYKLKYIEYVRHAVDKYLNWSDRNTTGIRFFTRFQHFCHGASGRKRALKLRDYCLKPDKTFYDIVALVADVQQASGITQHALKRYLYQEFTTHQVISNNMNDGEFYQSSRHHLENEFLNLQGNEFSQLHELSPLALTETVRLAQKNSDETFTLESRTPIAYYQP